MGNSYDIVIAGGGHAGIEAAQAAHSAGLSVAIVTMEPSSIGRLSCNPAIGGLGKGHLVQEIDALGGVMGRAADHSGIQFKMLNTSKGRAVWSLRAQVDKKIYPAFIKQHISQSANIHIIKDEIVDFCVDNSRVTSVVLRSNGALKTSAFIVCSGTFLNGKIHIGEDTYSAGRFGERPSIGLTENIKNKGLISYKLKTGTPPRVHSDSIDWSVATLSRGDEFSVPFSILSKRPFRPLNVPCHIVNTNTTVHSILKDNLNKSPMYSGKIDGAGPRYCPSIEDKVVRFSDRDRHSLFLEPEWLGSNQIYVNGFSTSMPKDIQEKALRQINGFKSVVLIRPGYAIEYDYFPTYQLKSTLESKLIEGLYFAGQLNGTSGYEEAAAQGLIAGANAALKIKDNRPLILKRNQAYIGVLIDDLITKDINEPYRMFTSSAEYRLSLRGDNASLRLTDVGFKLGFVSTKQYGLFNKYRESVDGVKDYFKNNQINVGRENEKISDFIKHPQNSIFDKNTPIKIPKKYTREALFSAETDIKYDGYVKIENRRIEQMRRFEGVKIPHLFNYGLLVGLSNESRERLTCVRPETLGQASRLAGVKPSDLSVLAVYLKSKNK